MNKPLKWDQAQVFLAVAETGSLSAAAGQLGLTQPTVGRQIKALERDLGTQLFARHARGLRLTETGQKILPRARQMREAANAMALTLAGADDAPSGTVRITASRFVAHYLLPGLLADLRQAAPAIQIELVASDQVQNLLFREADIAIRMVRPEQLDVVAKHLGDLQLGMFAATSYLARRGMPARPEDLPEHDLVGYDRSQLILQGFREMGFPATPQDFATRCDDQSAYWQLVRAGCGIGFCQVCVAEGDPDIQQVLPDLPLPALPVWLTTHAELRHSPKVARVWDALDQGLRRHCRGPSA